MLQIEKTRAPLAVLLLFGAAAGVTACDVVVGTMDGGRGRAERQWARTYTLSGAGPRLEVVNVNGAVSVETGDGDVLDVKALVVAHGPSDEAAREALDNVEIEDEVSGAEVRLRTASPKGPRRRPVEVTYTIRAPRRAKLEIETVNGSITVNGAAAALKAESTNGSIDGTDLSGDVKAETTNGSIKIRMAALGDGGVALETTNGSVDLRLPGDAKATLSARSVNGGISVADLPFERTGEAGRRKLDGAINGGGAPLRLETVNGRIRVGRAQ